MQQIIFYLISAQFSRLQCIERNLLPKVKISSTTHVYLLQTPPPLSGLLVPKHQQKKPSNSRSYALSFIQNAQAPAPGYAPVAGNSLDLCGKIIS